MIIYPKHSVFLLKPCVHSSWGFLLEKFKNEPWEGVFFARLKPDKQNTWNKAVQSLSADSDRKQLVDYSNLSSFAIAFKQELTDELRE